LKRELPTLRALTRDQNDIESQAARVLPHVEQAIGAKARARLVPCASQIGSGSLPVDSLPSCAIAVEAIAGSRGSAVQRMAAAFRALPVPVLGRINGGAFLMDMRCLDDEAAFVAQLPALKS
jgi:L-seryl-tRNA(Ser) seleniumtransferase